MKEISDRLLSFAASRGWERFHEPKDLAMSVSIEAAELLEVFQWREAGQPISDAEREEISSEIADVAQYLLLLCARSGVDFEEAISKKIEANERRFPVNTSFGVAKPEDQTKVDL